MPSPQDIQQLQERLAAHRATLATLLTQQATLGSAYAPPAVASGIREAREAIQRIKVALRGWGVEVEDLLDDEALVSDHLDLQRSRADVLPRYEQERKQDHDMLLDLIRVEVSVAKSLMSLDPHTQIIQVIKSQIRAGKFDQALAQLEVILFQTPDDRDATSLVAQIIEAPAAPFTIRMRAGDLARKVGDPRIPIDANQWQVELTQRTEQFGAPKGYWCYVRQGEYRIGGWERNEEPTTVTLPAFWIARYPITVAQYAPFVAVGYGERAECWWTKEGWQWKQDQGRQEPWGWGKLEYRGANQPIIGITWYEAMAFCAWQTQQVDTENYEVRLPTEAEWEAASAYDTDMKRWPYPWGEGQPTVEQAIYDASQLNHPASVGSCPAGVASCGALDLIGNVWEVMASSYQRYPAQSNVLVEDFTKEQYDVAWRGGAWNNKRMYARCGARIGLRPVVYGVTVNLGFRVCLLIKSNKKSNDILGSLG